MSEHTNIWTECDVCSKPYYSKDSTTKIKFGYDGNDFQFDCCYECLRGEKIRSVYSKIISIFKLKKIKI